MNLVGKIFTVLILIMSVAFMMLAVTVFATHRNWRDEVLQPNGLKAQIEDLRQTNRQLQAEAERKENLLAMEQVTRQFALGALQSELQSNQAVLQRLREEHRALQAAHGISVETLNTNGLALNLTMEELVALRGQLRDARQARDEAFLSVAELTDKVNAIEGQRQNISERNEQLVAQVGRMQGVLDRHDLTEFTPWTNKPPSVDGVVTRIGGRDLIEISIGSDDGLRKGHTLEVFRNNSYLGRIVVQVAEPDKAVGRILPEYRKGTIRRGDRVATKLS